MSNFLTFMHIKLTTMKLFFKTFFFLISIHCFGSPQIPDYIIYKKDTIPTYNLIVENYLQSLNPNEDKLFGLSFRNTTEGLGTSLNCWRGYQAIYEVENDSLFVKHIISCFELKDNKKINLFASQERMNKIFGKKVKNGKVFIDWYSGIINFPLKIKKNKMLRWDGVFYRIYENENILVFSDGLLKKYDIVNNYEKVPNGIYRKDKTKLSDIIFKKLKKIKWKGDCSEKFLVTINEKGKISKIIMQDYKTDKEIDEAFDRNEYNYCINTMLEALKNLQFDIIKNKGIPISEDVYLEIWLDSDTGKLENWTD